MRRREFITPLDGAAAAWPVAARVQQTKRVGVLMNGATSEPTGQSHLTTFVQGLRKLGWIDRQNLRIEVRWSAGDTNRMQAYATDLVGLLRPDVVLVASTPNLIAPQRSTRTIPIVFTQVTDPVAQGFVPNLTQPSGTGAVSSFVYRLVLGSLPVPEDDRQVKDKVLALNEKRRSGPPLG